MGRQFMKEFKGHSILYQSYFWKYNRKKELGQCVTRLAKHDNLLYLKEIGKMTGWYIRVMHLSSHTGQNQFPDSGAIFPVLHQKYVKIVSGLTLVKHHRLSKMSCRHALSSWCGRIHPRPCLSVHRCGPRSSHAGPVKDWQVAVHSGSRRNRQGLR